MKGYFFKIMRNKVTLTITFAKLVMDVFLYNVATILAVFLR